MWAARPKSDSVFEAKENFNNAEFLNEYIRDKLRASDNSVTFPAISFSDICDSLGHMLIRCAEVLFAIDSACNNYPEAPHFL